MRPTLQARGLKESLLQYLSTTYALTDEGAREALHRFLGDEASGMFRGPYLRIRTPFSTAEPGWRALLEWAPERFEPYAYQAEAFARLSSHRREPQPTLVTTGTGSGKTESSLLPVLDHCRRERAAGRAGVKAVLLYPMNALAGDQAADELRAYATGGLRGAVEEAARAWREREEALRIRLRAIDEAHGELVDSDPEQARQKAELDAERRGVGKRLGMLGDTPAQAALCDLGVAAQLRPDRLGHAVGRHAVLAGG